MNTNASMLLKSPVTSAVSTIGRKVRTTPGLLKVALGSIFFAALIACLVIYWSVRDTRQVVQTIGKDAAPSIIAANEIRANLADMDASAANGFLGPGTKTQAVRDQYEKARQIVTDRIVTAAQNITYGDEERLPIRGIVDKLQVYTGLIETARAKGAPAGLFEYGRATSLMHGEILPLAEALDRANLNHLESEYLQSKNDEAWVQIQLYVFVALLLGILLLTQFFLTRRTRRMLNLPLALATLALLAFIVWAAADLSSAKSQLRVAKEDAFDSLNVMWKARAVAYDANGDESLFLLYQPDHQKYERSFRVKVNELVDAPITDDLVYNATFRHSGFNGLLGMEFRNITFAGEEAAAVNCLKALQAYLVIDGKVRTLEQTGSHQAAVDLSMGSQTGQANWAFNKFDAAVGEVISINQKEFDNAVAKSANRLSALPFIATIVLALVAILGWLGLRPRIREYRG